MPLLQEQWRIMERRIIDQMVVYCYALFLGVGSLTWIRLYVTLLRGNLYISYTSQRPETFLRDVGSKKRDLEGDVTPLHESGRYIHVRCSTPTRKKE